MATTDIVLRKKVREAYKAKPDPRIIFLRSDGDGRFKRTTIDYYIENPDYCTHVWADGVPYIVMDVEGCREIEIDWRRLAELAGVGVKRIDKLVEDARKIESSLDVGWNPWSNSFKLKDLG